MEENEVRRCLKELDPYYYDRMEKVLPLAPLMHDIFARSFTRELEMENTINAKLSVCERLELARWYKKLCMTLG